MNIRGILFDLDGVLISTDRLHYLAWKEVANQLHIPFDEAENDRLRGISREASLEILLERYRGPALTPAQKKLWMDRKNQLYRQMLQDLTPASVAPDVSSALRKLRAAGFRLALGSSSKNARLILARTNLTDQFDAIVDGTEITHTKPDPEIYLLAASRLALPPSSCAVVEDAETGVAAAKAGGMLSIGLGPSAAPARPDLQIRSISELPDLLVHMHP